MKKALEILKEILHFQDMSWQVEEKINAAIAEIEEAMKPKSCEGCKYNTYSDEFAHNCEHSDIFDYYEGNYLVPFDFCCNRYETKPLS